MASIYPKKRSPFWFIAYRDPQTGRTRDESTKLRRDNPEETRKARQLCAQRTADELGASIGRTRQGEDWKTWVHGFIITHYTNPLSRLRAENAWFNLSTYFRVKRIGSARVLTRSHCIDYLPWRTGPEGRKLGLRSAKHNTARVELQHLSAIMREAVLRGLATANPCLQLGIGRVKGNRKPEITDEQIRVIEKRLRFERGKYRFNEAMQIAWDIAMRHARRLRETCVRLADVDLRERTITFYNKGGEERTKLLHPELVPLFRRLKKEGREFAYDMPPNWSKVWTNFFKRCGLKGLSFHSTRITVVNILRRKRVDRRISKDYVDHSSVIVHEGYERWRPDDHVSAARALSRGKVVAPLRSSASNGLARTRLK